MISRSDQSAMEIDPKLEGYLIRLMNSDDVVETPEIARMIADSGYTKEELLSALEFDPDIDGVGECRGTFFFNPDNLPTSS